MSVPRTNARRRIVTEIPNCWASPAQTPAIILPSRERYQLRVRRQPASKTLPHYPHMTAPTPIVHPHDGQRLVASAMTLPHPQTDLPLGEDRDHAVAEREEQRQRRRVVPDDVEAEPAGEDARHQVVHRAERVVIDEEDRGQREERHAERARERRPGGAPGVPREERPGGLADARGERRRRA